LPRVSLGRFPTPLAPLHQLGQALGLDSLYLKDDGQSGEPYGGNKVRKLEFCLAEAVRRDSHAVLTFGYAGSNHALATGIYARSLGLRAVALLMKQANAPYVRRNLLAAHRVGIELRHGPGPLWLVAATLGVLCRGAVSRNGRLFVIPPGGSSPAGTVGYVDGAFELHEQIRSGLAPEPSRIYVACGSLGTAVGLALGLKRAGRRIPVIAVRVATPSYVNERRLRRLYGATVGLLRSRDPSFPRLELEPGEIELRTGLLGLGYARITAAGQEAVELAERLEGLHLEGTYTGKTMAALIADARAGAIGKGPALFWNTYNARNLGPLTDAIDYRELPPGFHRYFETPFATP
jgi:D-cysteine desulfhydrase